MELINGHHPRVLMRPTARAFVHQPTSREEIGGRARGRPVGHAA